MAQVPSFHPWPGTSNAAGAAGKKKCSGRGQQQDGREALLPFPHIYGIKTLNYIKYVSKIYVIYIMLYNIKTYFDI